MPIVTCCKESLSDGAGERYRLLSLLANVNVYVCT